MGLDALILVFWILSFKPAFSLSSFTYIKKFFSSSLLFAIMVVSSAYLSLLIFLLAILIPAFALPSLAFHTMYFALILNKEVTIYSLDVLLSQFGSSLCSKQLEPVLTVPSWPADRFPRKQVRWSGISISLRIFHTTQFSSGQFSCSVVSDSLRPHESQHARPPCPSPWIEGWNFQSHPLTSWLGWINHQGPVT